MSGSRRRSDWWLTCGIDYGVSLGETSRDGSLTAEQVFCLGNCALGPAAQVNGRLHGRLDEARLSSILDEAVSQ